jgi:iron complex outermembrane receptor protein
MEGSWSRLVTRIDGPVLKFDETNTPRTLAQLHSYFDVGADVEVNASAYYVSRIPGLGVDPYTRADLGLTWRPREGLALSLTGQNLLHAQHREVTGAEIPRSVFAQAAFEFGN